jgi:hypothetical protein
VSETKRLWEVDHPYYCNETAYSGGESYPRYKSFADFMEDFGDSDFDMNLVFRWDWSEGDSDGPSTFNGDVNYRNGSLMIFFMGQRKGMFWSREVEVCRADEPAVIAYLRPRMAHLMALWEPLSVTPEDGTTDLKASSREGLNPSNRRDGGSVG